MRLAVCRKLVQFLLVFLRHWYSPWAASGRLFNCFAPASEDGSVKNEMKRRRKVGRREREKKRGGGSQKRKIVKFKTVDKEIVPKKAVQTFLCGSRPTSKASTKFCITYR